MIVRAWNNEILAMFERGFECITGYVTAPLSDQDEIRMKGVQDVRSFVERRKSLRRFWHAEL